MGARHLKKIIVIGLFSIIENQAHAFFLAADRPEMINYVQKRLKTYNVSDVKISYDLKSPKKFLKNSWLALQNGYYKVNFNIDKSKYTCDIDHVVSGGVEEGNYLMNCKSDSGPTAFPSELDRLFAMEFSNAIPGSIVFSKRLNPLSGFDDVLYDVEYDSKQNTRVRCRVMLEMDRHSYLPVDQTFRLKECDEFEKLGLKRPDPVCPSGGSTLFSNVQITNDLYDFYSDKLNQLRPLPQEIDCSRITARELRGLASKMISTDKISLHTKSAKDQAVESAILQNALIVQAYSRLYVQTQAHLPKGAGNPLQWLGVASHSSSIVGKTLRVGQQAQENDRPGLASVEKRDQAFLQEPDGARDFFLKNKATAMKTLAGNVEVFKDLFWLNLAASYCGPAKAASLCEDLKRSNPDGKAIAHYDTLANAWSLIAEGTAKKDPELISKGNIQILAAEQKDILQPIMYSSTAARTTNAFGVFNSLAKTDFYDPSGKPLQTFEEFSNAHGTTANLSNFDSRFNWMKYIVENQAQYIDKTNQTGGTKTTFLPPLMDAYDILSDY